MGKSYLVRLRVVARVLKGEQVQSWDIVLGATGREGSQETRPLPPPAVRPRDLVHAACTMLCEGLEFIVTQDCIIVILLTQLRQWAIHKKKIMRTKLQPQNN